MKENVGSKDRAVRIAVGAVLILLSLLDNIGIWSSIGAWGWIGIVPLATGLLNFCPLYSVLGFSTCPVEKLHHFGEKQD